MHKSLKFARARPATTEIQKLCSYKPFQLCSARYNSDDSSKNSKSSRSSLEKAFDMFQRELEKLESVKAAEEKPLSVEPIGVRPKARSQVAGSRSPRVGPRFTPREPRTPKRDTISEYHYSLYTNRPQYDMQKINEERDKQSFATLLRNSTFMNMGNPKDKVVIGKIFLKEGKDLYIDFGAKFYCVCPDPEFDDR